MICPKCGAFIRDDAKFCNECGEKLNKKPTVQDIPTIMIRPRDEKFDLHKHQAPEETEPEEGQLPKQKWWVILTILLSGALFALVAVLLYNVLESNQKIVVTPTQGTQSSAVETKAPETVMPTETVTETDAPTETEKPTEEPSTEPLVTEAPYEDVSVAGIVYRVYENYAVLLKSYSENRILEIPAEVFETPVTLVANGAFEGTKTQYLILPEGLNAILNKVFIRCPSLKEIYIPESVYTIQSDSFDTKDVLIISHEGAFAQRYAEEMDMQWQEGDSTTEQY